MLITKVLIYFFLNLFKFYILLGLDVIITYNNSKYVEIKIKTNYLFILIFVLIKL